ncbi:MAG: heavy-metal-associated domain-containing protein [Chloroflexi bacterium]|nr:heavy-metal-associated domain-containing protein [Chloroflexota bacterium]
MQRKEGVFRVTGMTCDNCVALIAEAVERLPGVLMARGDLAAGIFKIAYDAAHAGPEAIVQAIEQAGKEGAWQHTYRVEAFARPKQQVK